MGGTARVDRSMPCRVEGRHQPRLYMGLGSEAGERRVRPHSPFPLNNSRCKNREPKRPYPEPGLLLLMALPPLLHLPRPAFHPYHTPLTHQVVVPLGHLALCSNHQPHCLVESVDLVWLQVLDRIRKVGQQLADEGLTLLNLLGRGSIDRTEV